MLFYALFIFPSFSFRNKSTGAYRAPSVSYYKIEDSVRKSFPEGKKASYIFLKKLQDCSPEDPDSAWVPSDSC